MGRIHGQGKFTNKSGFTFEGEWANGLPSGKGSICFANGDTYTSQFKDGLS